MENNAIINTNAVKGIESREAAEMMGKRHDNLVRDIKGYIGAISTNSKLRALDYFIESTYVDKKGENRTCYILTKMGCEMVANKLTGQKGILFTAEYVKRFNEMEQVRHIDSYMIANPIERAKVWIKEEEKRIALAAQVKELEPKAKFADAVSGSPTSIPIGDLAKMMKQNGVKDIGQNRLFAWLRSNGWLMNTKDSWNMPTQKSMNMGFFEIKETPCTDQQGYVHLYKKAMATGKGQVYFLNKMLALEGVA